MLTAAYKDSMKNVGIGSVLATLTFREISSTLIAAAGDAFRAPPAMFPTGFIVFNIDSQA